MFPKSNRPPNPPITTAEFQALWKPASGPRPVIGALTRAQYRTLLRAEQRVFCRDLGPSFFFWLEQLEESAQQYGCDPDGCAIATDFAKLIRQVRCGHHTFTRPADLVSSQAHSSAVIIAAMTYA